MVDSDWINIEWTEYDNGKPPLDHKPVWIETFQEHINLAWFVCGLFWPYGGDINDGRSAFVDKYGYCEVSFWCYAKLPNPTG